MGMDARRHKVKYPLSPSQMLWIADEIRQLHIKAGKQMFLPQLITSDFSFFGLFAELKKGLCAGSEKLRLYEDLILHMLR